MAVSTSLICLAATLLASCASPHSTPALHGVSLQDADEIGRLIHARSSDRIMDYSRDENGEITAWVDDGHIWVATRKNGEWKLTRMGVAIMEKKSPRT